MYHDAAQDARPSENTGAVPDPLTQPGRPYDHAMDFYSDVLLELVTALGAALFIANAYALIRRSADRREGAREAVARSRPGSPVRKEVRATRSTLDQAPVARTVAFMIIGLVVAIWGIASIVA